MNHPPSSHQTSVRIEKVGIFVCARACAGDSDMTATTSTSALSILREMFPSKLRISTRELAGVLSLHPQSIRNSISLKKFPVKTYLDGHLMYADLRDVADYIDSKRPKPLGRPTKASKLSAAQ